MERSTKLIAETRGQKAAATPSPVLIAYLIDDKTEFSWMAITCSRIVNCIPACKWSPISVLIWLITEYFC